MTAFHDEPVHVTMTRAAASPSRHARKIRDLGLDANGCPLEEWEMNGIVVLVHVDDLPESDLTMINGVRVTTPARTVIDLAASLLPTQLDDLLRDFLVRGVITVEELGDRLAEPDMVSRPGAQVLRRHPVLSRAWPRRAS